MRLIKAKISLLILLAFTLISCNQGGNNSQNKSLDKTMANKIVLQAKVDLLAGISKAVCYSGFREGQHPDRGNGAVNPSYENTLEDLTILLGGGFNLIRVYDSGENSELVLKVIKENNLNIKVLLGMWLNAELSAHETCGWLTEPIADEELALNMIKNQEEIEKGILLANEFKNIIVAVNVGNEALVEWNDHKVDTDSIISYVNYVKSKIEQPVTVADNYDWWANHGFELAKAVDFVSIHVYPVWEGKDIDEGLSYSIANIKKVKDTLPGATIVITEAGWASVASEFGERASEEKQLRYYTEFMNWTAENNITTFFFEAFDEPWKGNPDNPMGAEKHWGLYNVDRSAKKVMQ